MVVTLGHTAGSSYQSHHLWNWNGYPAHLTIKCNILSIAPSLELKQMENTYKAANIINYQSHHLWNWNNKTRDGLMGTTLAINRTISGIETCFKKLTVKQSAKLSIAPSLELKRVIALRPVFSDWSINRTISGIETNFARHSGNFDFILSIAPSLELKLLPWFRGGHLILAINRTISGIETWIVAQQMEERWPYQSHHLWNWNFPLCNFLVKCYKLSIAPSLELKQNW